MTKKGHVTLEVTPRDLLERLNPLSSARPLVLLLDYDGTLQEIAPTPDLAGPDAELLQLLRRLGTHPETMVHVISGRPRDVLDRWLGGLPLALWAEHGFWYRPADTLAWVATAPLREGWRHKVEPIVARFTAATPGSSTEFKSASLSWHYRLADPEFGKQQAEELRKQLVAALRHEPLEARDGKKVIEVRSRSAHKGLPIRLILQASGPSAVLIAIGDDTTDEDMFAAIPANGASVHVGNERTSANYRLADPEAVRQWLNLLVAHPHRFDHFDEASVRRSPPALLLTKMTSRPVASNIGIVAKHHLRQAAPHLADISSWLRQRGLNAVFETATAALSSSCDWPVRDKEQLVREVDMVLVLGGDGTLLGMADRIGAAGLAIPILGVNFGSLGFLTEVTLPELYPALESAVSGLARIEERLMLRATTERRGETYARHIALNDVVIAKTARSRLVDLSVWVGDEFLTRVKGDGVIIATPTGSTAYNLAAGGPIVHPAVEGLVITPIAPHTLTNRPIVIPSSSAVRVQPEIQDRDEVFVTFDGQAGYELEAGDVVSVCRSPTALKLIRPSTRSYFEVLREKLKWGEQ